jgi:hypothetical protein
MGFNIAGLVLNKNYQQDLAALEAILGQKLSFDQAISFEKASENWKEDDYCDIYFTEQGTLVFLAMEIAGFDFHATKQTAFSFVLSEMSMVFCINYTQNNRLLRSLMVTEDGGYENSGEPLDMEEDTQDLSDLIFGLIEDTLGESFYDIDLSAPCFRYNLSAITPVSVTNDTQNNQISATETESPKNDPEAKKNWWKFW